ncbi:hypothetical protein AALO_G00255810 [Alosa alosa]|uniref:Uncharacterized protein n=1 Tax=Alosa alosa TaxID=278164 RepID=A0AAV6FNY6_9TELE|nr:hypothetical protein AALO_G00255810 [Alosa alosa]
MKVEILLLPDPRLTGHINTTVPPPKPLSVLTKTDHGTLGRTERQKRTEDKTGDESLPLRVLGFCWLEILISPQ